MATIQIHPLSPAGSDLFADNESYLKELTDAEMDYNGGIITTTPISISLSLWLWYTL